MVNLACPELQCPRLWLIPVSFRLCFSCSVCRWRERTATESSSSRKFSKNWAHDFMSFEPTILTTKPWAFYNFYKWELYPICRYMNLSFVITEISPSKCWKQWIPRFNSSRFFPFVRCMMWDFSVSNVIVAVSSMFRGLMIEDIAAVTVSSFSSFFSFSLFLDRVYLELHKWKVPFLLRQPSLICWRFWL